jgi:hypothetical protein
LRIRFHTKLDARRYKQMQRALVLFSAQYRDDWTIDPVGH